MPTDITTPIIGYDNLLLDSDSTTTGDGTDPENAYDWLPCDAWTTGAASGYLRADLGATAHSCDYYAVAGHDIFTRGGTCKMQYWTGAAYADIPGSEYTPTSNEAFMIVFQSTSAVRFQFVVSGLSAAADIAVVTFGARLELPVGLKPGYRPARFARVDEIYNARSQSGALLGRSLISTGTVGSLSLEHMGEDWVRAYLDPFIEACREQGWFLLWSPVNRPDEAAYLWTTGTPQPQYEDVGLMSCEIAYEGVTE